MARNRQSATSGRDDYLKDTDYFMAAAVLSAQRSNDPKTQVGACIVKENEIIAMGYNRMPNGDDGALPCDRNVCHPCLNAIINKSKPDVNGCTLYVTLFPCNECAKLIIQAGLKEVLYLSDKHHYDPETIASKTALALADIEVMEFKPTRSEVRIKFQ